METLRFGFIGGGLMGREFASAAARWCHLTDIGVKPEIVGIASRTEASCQWFTNHIPTIRQSTTDYRELLDNPDIDAIYCAVPHHLHERIYIDIIESRKHLLGEKPFGIDRAANAAIIDAAAAHPERVVRCVSQFPYYPGAQRIVNAIKDDRFGRIIEVECGFLHSSDLNPDKLINWKRIIEFNGEYGAMGDLGMHLLHIPFRAGWTLRNVRAILSNIREKRKNAAGEWVPCETWDNATLLCEAADRRHAFPMTVKMFRISPGETNTWYIKVIGEKLSARFSTKYPRTLETLKYVPGGDQLWRTEDLGYDSVYKTISAATFEFGFGDAVLQMFAAFCDQVVKGADGDVPFGCATLSETQRHHDLLTAALESQKTGTTVTIH